MKLDDTQKKSVAAWINEGAKLADIQKRLGAEFGLSLTYMEVRMLVDDLKVMPKDPPAPPAPVTPPPGAAQAPAPAPLKETPGEAPPLDADAPDTSDSSGDLTGGRVTVTVDVVTRPGSLVSGGVTFRDGVTAQWYLDQMGRLGLASSQAGYKPAAADVQAFQIELDKELRRLGM